MPNEVAKQDHAAWSDLSKYPRSLAVSWMASIGAQTAGYGIILWAPDFVRSATWRDAGLRGVSVPLGFSSCRRHWKGQPLSGCCRSVIGLASVRGLDLGFGGT